MRRKLQGDFQVTRCITSTGAPTALTANSLKTQKLPKRDCVIVLNPKVLQWKKTRWPENPKAGRQTARLFFKSCGVGSNALRETDAKSLLRRRATIHHSMLPQLRLDFLVAVSANVYNVVPFHLSSRYLCLGPCSVWFAAEEARTKCGRTEHGATWKPNDGVAQKKSRRELTKRARALRY